MNKWYILCGVLVTLIVIYLLYYMKTMEGFDNNTSTQAPAQAKLLLYGQIGTQYGSCDANSASLITSGRDLINGAINSGSLPSFVITSFPIMSCVPYSQGSAIVLSFSGFPSNLRPINFHYTGSWKDQKALIKWVNEQIRLLKSNRLTLTYDSSKLQPTTLVNMGNFWNNFSSRYGNIFTINTFDSAACQGTQCQTLTKPYNITFYNATKNQTSTYDNSKGNDATEIIKWVCGLMD